MKTKILFSEILNYEENIEDKMKDVMQLWWTARVFLIPKTGREFCSVRNILKKNNSGISLCGKGNASAANLCVIAKSATHMDVPPYW